MCCWGAQLYGCNVLNLGNSKVLSVHAATARQIVRDPHFKGEVQVVNFTPITSMYGAVHCSSQVSHFSSPLKKPTDFLFWPTCSVFHVLLYSFLPISAVPSASVGAEW